MIDIEKLEAGREAAAIDKSDLFDFYHKHWSELTAEVKRLRAELISAQESYISARGFGLREDRPIREGVKEFEGCEEAYSLHTLYPFERYYVFAGRREWAVEQAFNYVKGLA